MGAVESTNATNDEHNPDTIPDIQKAKLFIEQRLNKQSEGLFNTKKKREKIEGYQNVQRCLESHEEKQLKNASNVAPGLQVSQASDPPHDFQSTYHTSTADHASLGTQALHQQTQFQRRAVTEETHTENAVLVKQLKESENKWKEQVHRLNMELADENDKVQRLTAQVQSSAASKEKWKAEANRLQQEKDAKHHQGNEDLQTLKTTVEKLEEEKIALNDEITKLQAKLDKKSSREKELKDEIAYHKGEIEKAHQQIQFQGRAVTEEKHTENAALVKQLNESENKWKEQVDRLNMEVQRLTAQVQSSAASKEKWKAEANRLQQEKDAKHHQGNEDLKTLNTTVEKLEEEKNAEITKLQARLDKKYSREKELKDEIAYLKGEIEKSQREPRDDAQAIQKQLRKLQNDNYVLTGKVKEQNMLIIRLKNNAPPAAPAAQAARPQRPTGIKIVLPLESSEDSRVKPVWQQLVQRIKREKIDISVTIKRGCDIEPDDGIVILPCIAASRVGSDLSAAMDKTKLSKKISPVIVIFNHLAVHVQDFRVKTRERLTDRGVVADSLLVVDAVYWDGVMSECRVNDELMTELKAVLTKQR